jgi:O-antigen ligase
MPLMISLVAFWFWFVFGSKPLLIFLFFRWNPALGTLVNGILSATFAFSMVVIASCSPHRKSAPSPISAAELFVGLFLAWTGVTLFWTHSNSLWSASGYWGVLMLDVLAVRMMMRLSDSEETAERSIMGLVIGSSLYAVATLALAGHVGYDGQQLGDMQFLHPNTVGYQMSFAGLCALYLIVKHRMRGWVWFFWLSLGLLLVFVLFMSLSKTSIGAFAVACVVFLAFARMGLSKKMITVLAIGGLMALSYDMLANYLSRYLERNLGQTAETLSGRTEIWSHIWSHIEKSPLAGYGYLSLRGLVGALQAHNEWLQLWFSFGIVGVVIAVMLYISYLSLVWRAVWTVPSGTQAPLGLALLVSALIRGVTEASMTGLVFPLPLMMLMIIWLCPPETKVAEEVDASMIQQPIGPTQRRKYQLIQ